MLGNWKTIIGFSLIPVLNINHILAMGFAPIPTSGTTTNGESSNIKSMSRQKLNLIEEYKNNRDKKLTPAFIRHQKPDSSNTKNKGDLRGEGEGYDRGKRRMKGRETHMEQKLQQTCRDDVPLPPPGLLSRGGAPTAPKING